MPLKKALKIHINGIVQGVGFRPWVYSLAVKSRLTGWILNSSNGVDIQVSGEKNDMDDFIQTLINHPPPLSQIDSMEFVDIEPFDSDNFKILDSRTLVNAYLPVSPDISTCDDCLREMFNPQDRRYRYPFINCTNCGPRFSIAKDIPYDRHNTTMASFQMCPACQREYNNPLDRRYHAQPTACPDCGPQVQLIIEGKVIADADEAILLSRQLIKEGKILSIKGIGGYHLACDARNSQAVSALRDRKKRSDKPFALMAYDMEAISKYCLITEGAKSLLTSKERPIVLLPVKNLFDLSGDIAPRQNHLGFMLPYSPLHHLLLQPDNDVPQIWVMTSANLSEEPVAYRDEEALERLNHVADAFLIHNREIHIRVDDSVGSVFSNEMQPIRRARGYAPCPIRTSADLPQIFAAGAELKNTFCLTRDHYAFISHHIGDLENLETFIAYREAVEHYQRLFRIQPEVIACDLHPDYLASRFAKQLANEGSLKLVEVQHHHAHLASCLADNQRWKETAIGLIYDGTGLGNDGAIWGGEVLVGNCGKFKRAYHLRYIPLAGGDASIRTPARMALSYLWRYELDWDEALPPVKALCMEDRALLRIQLEKNINTMETSSMGRLFDAVSSLIGIRHRINYEGQAAIELESSIEDSDSGFYPVTLGNGIIDTQPLIEALISDLKRGLSSHQISSRFHQSIAVMSLEICKKIRAEKDINLVALSGGVWQNKFLFSKTYQLLKQDGFDMIIHKNVPANDGGLSLGQAFIAASINE